MNSIEQRQVKTKELVINQLKKTPIVQIASDNSGVGRSTYYRWRKKDKEFAKSTDAALLEGSFMVNDLAESKIIRAIKNNSLAAATYWLKHHHPSYHLSPLYKSSWQNNLFMIQ